MFSRNCAIAYPSCFKFLYVLVSSLFQDPFSIQFQNKSYILDMSFKRVDHLIQILRRTMLPYNFLAETSTLNLVKPFFFLLPINYITTPHQLTFNLKGHGTLYNICVDHHREIVTQKCQKHQKNKLSRTQLNILLRITDVKAQLFHDLNISTSTSTCQH